MNRILFRGILPALVTPLDEKGGIREPVTRRLVGDLARKGISGYYILGGTGEGVALDRDLRMAFAELVKDCAPKGLPIINHIAAADLSTVRLLARHARKIGMDAIASVPPFFFHYDERGILDYFRAMSDASDGLPMLVYCSPFSGPPLSLATVEKLLDVPGFVGLKYTSPNYYQMSLYKQLDNGNINILNGPDETCVLGLLMGADGAIGTTYNMTPELFVRLYDAVQAGDIARAVQLQKHVNVLIRATIDCGKGIEAAKAALQMMGYEVGDTVQPMQRMDEREKQVYFQALRAIGFPDNYR